LKPSTPEEGRKKEGLGILESWIGVPISMNSVLDGLRERRLEDIQSAMLEKRKPRLLAAYLEAYQKKERKKVECHQHRAFLLPQF
jgi:hypothetical protein